MAAGDGFDELLADRAHRVERGHGVLDDETDVGPSDGAVLAFGKTDELAAEKAVVRAPRPARPRIERARTLLPEPDSPMSAWMRPQ